MQRGAAAPQGWSAGPAEEGNFVVMLETKLVLSLHSNDLHDFAWHMAYLGSFQLLLVLAKSQILSLSPMALILLYHFSLAKNGFLSCSFNAR